MMESLEMNCPCHPLGIGSMKIFGLSQIYIKFETFLKILVYLKEFFLQHSFLYFFAILLCFFKNLKI